MTLIVLCAIVSANNLHSKLLLENHCTHDIAADSFVAIRMERPISPLLVAASITEHQSVTSPANEAQAEPMLLFSVLTCVPVHESAEPSCLETSSQNLLLNRELSASVSSDLEVQISHEIVASNIPKHFFDPLETSSADLNLKNQSEPIDAISTPANIKNQSVPLEASSADQNIKNHSEPLDAISAALNIKDQSAPLETSSTDLNIENQSAPQEASSAASNVEGQSASSSVISLIREFLEPSSAALCPQTASASSSDTNCPDSTKANVRLNGQNITGHKKCEYGNGCTVQPSFNYPGEMGGMFCGCHRLEGMVNVVNKMCEFEGCHKRPSLNYPGVRPAIRCGEHKLPGMTNSFRKLDTNVLSGDLKEKAEELKKRPKKRGDMIKVQRHFIKEKIFSAVITDELTREGQTEANASSSPTNSAQVTLPLPAALASNSQNTPAIAPSFVAQASVPNLPNVSNVSNMVYDSSFQTSNLPMQSSSKPMQTGNALRQSSAHLGPNPLFSPDFAAAYVANMNMLSGDFQRMKNLRYVGAADYLPSYFPGMHQLQFNQMGQFNPFSAAMQPCLQEGRPSLYSNPIPPVAGYMPPQNVYKEGAEDVDLSIFASIASSMSHDHQRSSFSKRQKLEDGTKGKIAELLSRTSEEKSGGAFANVAGRSFRPIVGRATPMTFPKC